MSSSVGWKTRNKSKLELGASVGHAKNYSMATADLAAGSDVSTVRTKSSVLLRNGTKTKLARDLLTKPPCICRELSAGLDRA